MIKINVSDILKESYNVVVLDFENDMDGIKFKVLGDLKNANGVIELTGTIFVEFQGNCGRCLKLVNKSTVIDMKENIISSEDAENSDNYFYEGKIFNLENLLRDYIYLNIPDRVLCDINCKGLCTECGEDLNKSLCTCDKKDINPKFDILKDFFDK